MAIKMYLEGLGFRSIGSMLNINYGTVAETTWRAIFKIKAPTRFKIKAPTRQERNIWHREL